MVRILPSSNYYFVQNHFIYSLIPFIHVENLTFLLYFLCYNILMTTLFSKLFLILKGIREFFSIHVNDFSNIPYREKALS